MKIWEIQDTQCETGKQFLNVTEKTNKQADDYVAIIGALRRPRIYFRGQKKLQTLLKGYVGKLNW